MFCHTFIKNLSYNVTKVKCFFLRYNNVLGAFEVIKSIRL